MIQTDLDSFAVRKGELQVSVPVIQPAPACSIVLTFKWNGAGSGDNRSWTFLKLTELPGHQWNDGILSKFWHRLEIGLPGEGHCCTGGRGRHAVNCSVRGGWAGAFDVVVETQIPERLMCGVWGGWGLVSRSCLEPYFHSNAELTANLIWLFNKIRPEVKCRWSAL